jgi:N-methylhydantoinase A
MHLGVDVGGTFTDAVLYDGSALHAAKVPTTPDDQSRGVGEAIQAALAKADATAAAVERFAHGMTVATNALLEERGARTALVATEGFTDVLDVARQNRPHLYRLCAPKPPPLVPEAGRIGVRERIGPEGVIEALSPAEVERVVDAVRRIDPEAVAVCLLFAYLDPSHERLLAERLRRELPNAHISASHEVLPRFREYERCSTTVIDAYLSPRIAGYLRHLSAAAGELGLPDPLVMLSSGGVAPIEEAAAAGGRTVLSGPAGGAIGAGLLARLCGDGSAIGFDMGGTSCDVCVIEDGAVRRTDSRMIGGRPLQLPMVDIHTVGAGGGSIAWRDAGGALRVGPRSAGADPGPACYGRGGSEPTVTDANLLLGYLDGESRLAGDIRLDAEAAREAVSKLGDSLGLAELETAEGMIRVANQEMVRALRVVTVEGGVDPRGFALLPFGGAGPMHAVAVAEELEIGRVLCPRASGVLSALGLIASERRRDVTRTVLLTGERLSGERIAAEVAGLANAAAAGLVDARLEVEYAMRYRGQSFELRVTGGPEPDVDELTEMFAAAHEKRYGYRDDAGEVELVDIHVAAIEAAPQVRPTAPPGRAELRRSTRRARFAGDWMEADVLSGEPPPGFACEGPAILELPEATLVLPPRWRAEVDGHGTIGAERLR